MNPPKSILDQIIESRNIQEASLFNPSEIISELLKELSPKEREVVSRRFGLDGTPIQTLEEIGSVSVRSRALRSARSARWRRQKRNWTSFSIR